MGWTTQFGAVALVTAMAAVGTAAPAEAARRSNDGAKLCRQGGWQDHLTAEGQSFDSRKACTSYASRGGALRVNPYPGGKQACDELSGSSFSVHNFTLYTAWRCAWQAPVVGSDELGSLALACRAGGGDFGGTFVPAATGLVGFECLDMP